MQKTEYGYRRAIRIGIICLIFALCMGEYAFGSVVVDEVLIGGQEEQAPVDAAPAAQESAEPDALSKLQAEPDVSQPTSEPQAEHATSQPTSEWKAKPAVSQPTSEPQAQTESQSTSTSQEKTYTYLQNEKKVQNPSIKQADATSTAQTDPGQSKVPAESTASVSANDRQQFHVPNQEMGIKQLNREIAVEKMAVERLRNRKGRHRSSLLSGRTLQRQQAKKKRKAVKKRKKKQEVRYYRVLSSFVSYYFWQAVFS